MNKKYDAAKGGAPGTKNSALSKYSDNKSSAKSSAQTPQGKYSTETKYSVKNAGETTKYSSQEKCSSGSSGPERRSSYKSVERWDNEKNAALEKNKYLSTNKYSSSTTKGSSWGSKGKDESKDKYSSSTTKDSSWGSKNKDESKDKYSSSTTKDKDEAKDKYSSSTTKDSSWRSKNKDESKDKYSFSSATKAEAKTSWTGDKYKTSSFAEDRWCSKNFAAPDAYGRSFSSQSAASSWEERNRGRAFPYDRDHDLRRSQHRYDADVKSLDRLEPKYRKAAMAAGLTVAVGAVGPSSTAKADSIRVRDRDDHHAAGAASATTTPVDPTGCHNCALQ